MSIQHFVEKWDATHGIPRPKDAPHLTPYHAFLRCVRDGLDMLHLVICGFVSAWLLWIAADSFQVTTEVRLVFIAFMLLGVVIAFMEASHVALPYLRLSQRVSHGSAMWADPSWLKKEGFVPNVGGETPPGQLKLGTLTTGHDLVLPPSHTLRHTALFGPPGSGKSATFLMSFIRDWARSGSVVVLDPKGELYEQTASGYRRIFRLDLQNSLTSDGWNFVPDCRGDAEFAHEVASIIIGLDETKRATDSDRFWQMSEIAALTAILLHLPEIVDNPTPAMINEFIADRKLDPEPGQVTSSMAKEMQDSPSLDARLYWGTFTKAKREVQGGILTGLAVKCAPFGTPNVKSVTSNTTDPNRTIDLKLLRSPDTAIYVVIPEGDASRYATFLSTFFGLAMDSLRKSTVEPESVPSLFVFDEAGNIPLHGLKEMLGVGRGRKVGLVLGYQNISQVYAQYGRESGDAILGSIGTMLFLPGLDDKTAKYAAGRVGTTTVLQRTSVDGVGSKYDNERLAEVSRDLLDHAELRQLVRHTQAVAIIDTAPPIKFRFPPIALGEKPTHAAQRRRPTIVSLAEAEARIKAEAGEDAELEDKSSGDSASNSGQPEDTQPESSGATKTGSNKE